MSYIVPAVLGSIGLYFYFDLTGFTGLIILFIIIALAVSFVYFKQNLLLYMPGIGIITCSYSRDEEIAFWESLWA